MRLISGEASPSRFTNHNHSICRIQGRRDPSQATSGSKHAKARILPFGTSQALTPSLPSVLRNLSADCITSSPTQCTLHLAMHHALSFSPRSSRPFCELEAHLLVSCIYVYLSTKFSHLRLCRILWEVLDIIGAC
jgi:hypothetical protein